MNNNQLNRRAWQSACVLNGIILAAAIFFFWDYDAGANAQRVSDGTSAEIVLFEDFTGVVSNSSYRITFNWSQTSGDPIVFENDHLLFPNGTVLLS